MQKSNFAEVGFPQRNRLIKRELAGSEITQLRDSGSGDRPWTKNRLSRNDCTSASTERSVLWVFLMSSLASLVAASSDIETSWTPPSVLAYLWDTCRCPNLWS